MPPDQCVRLGLTRGFQVPRKAMLAEEIVWSAMAVNADLLVTDGDPLADVRLLQQPGRMPVVMKQGRMHRCTLAPDA